MVALYILIVVVLVWALAYGHMARSFPKKKDDEVDTDPHVRYARHVDHTHPEKENP